jgi:cytochrome c
MKFLLTTRVSVALGFVALAGINACSSNSVNASSATGAAATSAANVDSALATPQPLPSGAYGNLVRYGRDIIVNTKTDMPGNVGAAMSCEACHIPPRRIR